MKEACSSTEGPCATTPGMTTKHWLCAGRASVVPQSLSQTIPPLPRIFGYNRAVARSYSHFGGVEEGTQFAISDLRSCLSFIELTWFQTNFAL